MSHISRYTVVHTNMRRFSAAESSIGRYYVSSLKADKYAKFRQDKLAELNV